MFTGHPRTVSRKMNGCLKNAQFQAGVSERNVGSFFFLYSGREFNAKKQKEPGSFLKILVLYFQ